jgi:FMN-dependent NADH-azoreductase
MAVSLKKKIQNYTVDQGATFEKTIGAENSSSTAVTISSGTVAGAVIKNFAYANTLQTFTTSLSGANCTFSLTATQTAALAEGKFYYTLTYTQSGGVIKERLAEGLITVEPSAEINNG